MKVFTDRRSYNFFCSVQVFELVYFILLMANNLKKKFLRLIKFDLSVSEARNFIYIFMSGKWPALYYLIFTICYINIGQ